MSTAIFLITFLIISFLLILVLIESSKNKKSNQIVFVENTKTLLFHQNLVSHKLRIKGRIDRIEKIDDYFIPVETKSSHKVRDSHKYQAFVYALLLEEKYKKPPPYVIIELVSSENKKRRIQIPFTIKEREKTLYYIKETRKVKKGISPKIEDVKIFKEKCNKCSFRHICELKKI